MHAAPHAWLCLEPVALAGCGSMCPADGFTVYLVTNKANGKRYVGITTNPVAVRWGQHVRRAYNQGSRKTALAAAIVKHGPDAFTVEEFASARNRADLLALERIVIAQLGTNRNRRGYNMTEGGDTPAPPTPASRAAISAAMKGKPKSAQTRAKFAARMLGTTMSPETRAKLTGRKRNEETKAKLRAGWDRRRARGWSPSEEARRKLSAAGSRKAITPEYRAKLKAARATRAPVSEETRAKMIASAKAKMTPEYRAQVAAKQTGKKAAPQTRAKMAAAQEARWAKRKTRPLTET
jgi:group I intron endonuclease